MHLVEDKKAKTILALSLNFYNLLFCFGLAWFGLLFSLYVGFLNFEGSLSGCIRPPAVREQVYWTYCSEGAGVLDLLQ